MQVPLQITFRHMEASPSAEKRIEEEVKKLEKFHPNITHCRVVVESPHQHHHKGQLYQVSIDLTVPNKELIAGHGHGRDHAHEDVYVAIRDAFREIERQLKEFSRQQRGEVKTHENR